MLWLAQDVSGVVWLLQEYRALEDSHRVLGTAGAIVWAPANPLLGQRFAEESSGCREVVETDVTVERLSTGLGPYSGCLTVRWTNGNDEAVVYYAPGAGIVRAEWSGVEATKGWELQEINRAGWVGDELVADFGAAYGLWHCDSLTGWTQLNTVSPDLMLAADLEGDGVEELVVSFKTYGLYLYREPGGWVRINNVIPEAITRFGNGLVADFGAAYGLWHYDSLRGWMQLNTVSPDLMLAADVDSDGIDELAASFDGYGLYVYKKWSVWLQINKVNPEAIIRLGNGLVADFGSAYGLWHYDQERGWRQMHASNPERMVAADLDSDGIDELIASFSGSGLRVYKEGNDWFEIGGADPEDMLPFRGGLMVNYGAAGGLLQYDLEEGWRQLETSGPEWMLALDIDKDGREELLSSFGAEGLQVYRDGTDRFQLHSLVPVSALSINLLE
jgi:hypothetical protein